MKSVVVLALPRSGSSLLAGILNKLGVYMGPEKHLKRGKHANKYGCYENQDLLGMNLNILVKAGGCGINWVEIYDDLKIGRIVNSMKSEIKTTIKSHERLLWGWKDASVYTIIPHLHRFLNNPHYVYLKRDVDGVVDSQIRSLSFSNFYPTLKQGIPFFKPKTVLTLIGRCMKLFLKKGNFLKNKHLIKKVVIKGYERLDSFVQGKKALSLKLDDLVNNSKKSIHKISSFLNINPSKSQINNALNFVNPELIHV
jgi:hypothetical protein